MGYRTDHGGVAFKANDAKFQSSGSTWGMKLSQLHRQSGMLRIMTYSLPSMEYVQKQFERRPYDIKIICHSKFFLKAFDLKQVFPDIGVAVHPQMHAKVLLIEPQTMCVSSANFGSSGWVEASISVHSKDAHDAGVAMFDYHWNQSEEIIDIVDAQPRPSIDVGDLEDMPF